MLMRLRLDPASFWFLCAFVTLGAGCWWIVRTIPDSGDRAQAFFGMLVLVAVAFQAGTTRFGGDHR